MSIEKLNYWKLLRMVLWLLGRILICTVTVSSIFLMKRFGWAVTSQKFTLKNALNFGEPKLALDLIE